MEITIEHFPKNYLSMIYKAGRSCYGAKDFTKDITTERQFVEMLIRRGHNSVLEHICISIYNEGMSRSFLAQVTRHRLVSYSVKSQHFTKHNDFPYKELEDYGEHKAHNQLLFNDVMEDINELYKFFIEEGVPHYIAREILPNACLTNIYMTANVREWRHIINMRITDNNTPEIQTWAQTLLRTLYIEMPELFVDLRDKYFEAGE